MPRGIGRYDEARLQGRLWTPQAIQPALGCWYDAGDPSTITYATGVSSWRDKSNRGRHATQGTGTAQPTYSPVGPPRVNFAGNQFLATTVDTDTLWDVFVVAKPATTSPTGYRSLLNNTGTQHILLNTGTNNLGSYAGGFLQFGTRTWPNQVGLLYYRITFPPPNTTAWSGAARDGEATVGYITAAIIGTGTPILGNESSAGGQGWGDIYELVGIISSDSASNTDPLIHRSKLEGYAAWRWAALGAGGVVGLLPAAHPFKTRPPLIGD